MVDSLADLTVVRMEVKSVVLLAAMMVESSGYQLADLMVDYSVVQMVALLEFLLVVRLVHPKADW